VSDVAALLEIMSRLRAPDGGCPWDKAQTFETIAPFTIEEAYEVADVIAREAWQDLPDELGDLLFQIAFYAQMGAENGWFTFDDVHQAVVDKMVRRHPHVFADEVIDSAQTQTVAWEAHKRAERRAKGETGSVMNSVPRGLASMKRAQKLQSKAGQLGFDWTDSADVLPKLREEVAELEEALGLDKNQAAVTEELGDIVFTCANLARHHHIDLDAALRHSNLKFERRFRQMEEFAGDESTTLEAAGPDQLETYWQRAKATEKSS
jgi:ATP diphosphatase